jgi:hypothetical protein
MQTELTVPPTIAPRRFRGELPPLLPCLHSRLLALRIMPFLSVCQAPYLSSTTRLALSRSSVKRRLARYRRSSDALRRRPPTLRFPKKLSHLFRCDGLARRLVTADVTA